MERQECVNVLPWAEEGFLLQKQAADILDNLSAYQGPISLSKSFEVGCEEIADDVVPELSSTDASSKGEDEEPVLLSDAAMKLTDSIEKGEIEKAEESGWGLAMADWTQGDEAIVTAPYEYLMSQPGANFRGRLLQSFNVWLQVDEASLCIIDHVVNMLHNASLLVDDIQDGSALRRGSPTAHTIYGIAQTINCANYVYFLAQQELLKLPNPREALQIFIDELIHLHQGQGMELFWRDTITAPTEPVYLRMIANKTGGLFRLAVRLLQHASPTNLDLVPLADLIGLIYQILDDYKNLCSEKMTKAKGYCEDLTEGKFSFPIVHAVHHSASANSEILNILRARPTDDHLKAVAVHILENTTGSFAYTQSILGRLHSKARAEMDRIGVPNQAADALLAYLAEHWTK